MTEAAGPAATPLGTLDGAPGAAVDPRGVVTVDGRWSLDWWIGADDRWHLAGRERTARQVLLGDAPVVETRVRVPGGDAVQRAFGARDAQGDEHVVVEIVNDSRVPFAVALVLQPHDLTGARTDLAAIEVDGSVVRVGGRPVALLPRAPARATGATGWADVVDVVTSGRAGDALGDAAAGEGATAALLFPLAHTASLRVLLPRSAAHGGANPPPALPAAEQVAAGWARFVDRGARVQVPDSGLVAGVHAARAQLLLVGSTRVRPNPALVASSDREGFHDEAGELLDRLIEALRPWRRLGAALAADVLEVAARHVVVARDLDRGQALLPVLTKLARQAKGPEGEPARAALADALVLLDQPEAAASVRPPSSGPDGGPPTAPWEALDGLRQAASPTWTWPAGTSGRDGFLGALRDVLVHEHAAGLAALPAGLGPWAGQAVELHHAPTRFGPFSYAVRWHGERPALLWELAAPAGGPPVRITAPGLDPSWSSDAEKGEELLGSTRDDGVGMVVPGESFT